MEKSVLFSTWLVPTTHDRGVLSKVIARLGKTLDSPSFLLHITGYACQMPDDMVASVVSKIGNLQHEIHPFTLDVKKIDHSAEFFKAIFLEMNSHPMLDLIYARIKNIIGQYGLYELKPHLSLAYKDMTEQERQLMVDSLTLPASVTIGEIGYVVHHNWPEDHRKVDQWRYQTICHL